MLGHFTIVSFGATARLPSSWKERTAAGIEGVGCGGRSIRAGTAVAATVGSLRLATMVVLACWPVWLLLSGVGRVEEPMPLPFLEAIFLGMPGAPI
jgi:hypothetical protein